MEHRFGLGPDLSYGLLQGLALLRQWARNNGHPIHAKLITSSNPRKNTPGRPYQARNWGGWRNKSLLPLRVSTTPVSADLIEARAGHALTCSPGKRLRKQLELEGASR